MRIAILYNAVAASDSADHLDVLVQVRAVAAALRTLGHRVDRVACGLDLERVRKRLVLCSPDVVWNLVESLGGHDRLLHLVPALLDALGAPYTGSPAEVLQLATNKLATKAALEDAGLPVPPTVATYPSGPAPAGVGAGAPPRGRVIVKSMHSHGSPGLDDSAVLSDPSDLAAAMAELAPKLGAPLYAEPYLDGRELNLSLLETADCASVLPPAEILFTDYPAGKPRIVGFRAKWVEGSFEYRHTPRRFDFPPADRGLLERVAGLARAAWQVLGLRGYARVDVRVDAAGAPFILEVNANPCLSPDAGFAAALERARIGYVDAIAAVLAVAHERTGRRPEQVTQPVTRPVARFG